MRVRTVGAAIALELRRGFRYRWQYCWFFAICRPVCRGAVSHFGPGDPAERTSLGNSAGTESPCFPPQIEGGSISVHVPTVGEQGALDLASTDYQRENWCCQTGLNCRPLHYQWSALPLSYGSMPGSGESAKTAPTGGPILATRPRPAQARERSAGRRKIGKISAVGPPRCLVRPVLGRSGSRIRRRDRRGRVFAHPGYPDILFGGDA